MSGVEKYRLVTRSDFHGLVCAVLLKELDLIDEIRFVHPKDVQDGVADIRPGDICTNLPYNEGCHLVFDHHESETRRLGGQQTANHIIVHAAGVGFGDRRRIEWLVRTGSRSASSLP